MEEILYTIIGKKRFSEIIATEMLKTVADEEHSSLERRNISSESSWREFKLVMYLQPFDRIGESESY